MDESTMGSFRRRVPMLAGEFYSAWKNEMLEIFNEYHLNKYITSPCTPPIDPWHPTTDESLDMIRNLRTINLIIRGLPRNLIVCLPTLECAYTIWRYLEERFPDYSLKNLDEILQKSTALNKMNPKILCLVIVYLSLQTLCVPKEMLVLLVILFSKL